MSSPKHLTIDVDGIVPNHIAGKSKMHAAMSKDFSGNKGKCEKCTRFQYKGRRPSDVLRKAL